MNPTRILMVTTILFAGCIGSKEESAGRPSSKETTMDAIENQEILDEINAAEIWFHAKKSRAIWAKEITAEQTVKTLEGTELVKTGDYLCRGEIGEVWPQSAEDLTRKYNATEVVDPDGWRKYEPNPDAEGVMAAQVDHAFTVHASWGVLSGKAGDFIVKNFADKQSDYPKDVWIVDQQLFNATYSRVSD